MDAISSPNGMDVVVTAELRRAQLATGSCDLWTDPDFRISMSFDPDLQIVEFLYI